MNNSQKLKPVLFPCLRLLPQPPYKSTLQQMRFVHRHKELEVPGGFERFIGWRRSNTHRANRNTHINERKFKRLRGEKRVIIELEDDVERREMEKLMPDQLRIYMLRKGKPDMYKDISPRDWHEHQMTVQSLHDVLDPYVPPETSILTRVRKGIIDDGKDYFTEKWHDIRGYGLRRIKRKDGFGNFDLKEFTKEAETIYVSAFQALAKRDKRSLYDLVTESAFSNLWPDVERGTLQWEFVRFNEPSVVRNVRCIDIPQKSGNDIAQIIVRMHSTQKMALYDKDGHLLLGSMEEPREVLEYVVFENPVANLYGKWRYHAKVYPQWLQQPKQPLLRPKLLEETKAKTKNIPAEPTKLNSGLRNMMGKFDNKSKSGAEEKMDGTENTVKRALKGFGLAGKKDKSK